MHWFPSDVKSKRKAVAFYVRARGQTVPPSGMSRSMGRGRKANVMRLGEPADEAGLVDIFDPAEATQVGTVDERIKFRKNELNK